MNATGANVHDVTEAHNLLHGGETVVWGDAGYQGVHKREENLGLAVEWRVAMRPGSRRKLDPESRDALAEKLKAQVRAKVEHPFLRVKRLFGYGKVRYRGLGEERGASGAAVCAGQSADGGGSTVGLVRPAADLNRPYGPRRTTNAQSGAKRKGLSSGQKRPDDSSHSSRRPNKLKFRPTRPCSEHP